MQALVLDGGVKSALSIVRSLGARGIYVSVGGDRKGGLALWSRYASHTFVYRSPIHDPAGFLDDVEREAKRMGERPVIYSCSDATMLLLSRHRDRILQNARVVLPSAEALETAADKEKTRALAESLKIPTPPVATYTKYPVVVKPRHSAAWLDDVGVRGRVQFAFSEEEARALAGKIKAETGEEPLIQEWIRGGEFGFEALCHEGKVVASVGHRRMRSMHPTGGAAVVKTTVALDAGMETHARKLLQELQWEGVAMVEFKQDEGTGTPYLLEINPRFWGSLPLAVRAGVDFPFLYFLLAEGKLDQVQALAEKPYERRVTTRHMTGDMRHLLTTLFRKDPMRKVTYPSRPRAVLDFLAGFWLTDDVFSWSDPVPFVMEVLDRL